MTLDEAIKDLEHGTKQLEMEIESGLWIKGSESELCCKEGIALNKQHIEWLKELKELRGLVAASNVLAKDVLAVDTLCKQILEYRRLLKLAVEDIESTDNCCLCKYHHNPDHICQTVEDCFTWRYADEALKLIES